MQLLNMEDMSKIKQNQIFHKNENFDAKLSELLELIQMDFQLFLQKVVKQKL